MELTIRRTTLEEVDSLLVVQKHAFQEALERYKDYESSPATEAKERLLYKIQHYHHYTLLIGEEIVGGAEVRVKSDSHCYLNRICVLPHFQGKGIGKKTMKYLEEVYPQATTWSLSTPHREYRNHYLYEKMGYIKVGEDVLSENLTLFHYVKANK